MASPSTAIGFSVSVRLEWLEQAAALVSLGRSAREVRASLHEIIGEERLADPSKRADSRTRTVSVISALWVEPPEHLGGLRDRAVALLPTIPTAQHVAVHWGMSMAAYPFFACVAENTGRLLRLQGVAGGGDVFRRVAEQYGERPTTKRATSLTLQTIMQWGVLAAANEERLIEARQFRAVAPVKVGARPAAWLLEAQIRASGRNSASLRDLATSPAVFPFVFSDDVEAAVDASDVLVKLSLGVSDTTVALRHRD